MERFNLAQQPMAFAENTVVKEILAKEGTAALPISIWDGEVHLKGRYPTHDERPGWFQAVVEKTEAVV